MGKSWKRLVQRQRRARNVGEVEAAPAPVVEEAPAPAPTPKATPKKAAKPVASTPKKTTQKK